jgi:hypothetical protein
MPIFFVIFIEVAGFSTSIQAEDSCAQSLHTLRTEQRLHILSSEQYPDGVLYILGDGPFRPKKTAVLACQPGTVGGSA